MPGSRERLDLALGGTAKHSCKVAVSAHTHPLLVNLANLDMVILKTLPVLVGVQCALIMVFVCISLMIHNVEHLFCVYWPFCEVEGARVSALL